eukprot:5132055-Pyramimonas_sp.AAC.1
MMPAPGPPGQGQGGRPPAAPSAFHKIRGAPLQLSVRVANLPPQCHGVIRFKLPVELELRSAPEAQAAQTLPPAVGFVPAAPPPPEAFEAAGEEDDVVFVAESDAPRASGAAPSAKKILVKQNEGK